MIQSVSRDEIRRALNVEDLLKEARREAGLEHFGDESFMPSLRKLCECYGQDAKFHAEGLKDFRITLVRNLVNRLRIEEDLKRHPEILQEDVSDPLVVLGLPRSGTTKFQRMVAADSSLLKTYLWQLLNPARFPNARPGEPDPRIAAAIGVDKLTDEKNTAIRAAHVYAVNEPQDDQWLVALSFADDWYFSGRTPSDAYDDWVSNRSEPTNLEIYRYVRQIYQYLQWQQGGRKNRRWLFKNTVNIARLDEMVELYPKASYIHLHRHPRDFMGSVCMLMTNVWPLSVVDVDPKAVAAYFLKREKRAMDIYLESRDRLGLNDRIIDVQYDQLRSNPLPAVRELYRRAGHPLTAEAERAMMNWEKENEQGKHGKHVYTLEQFGLSEKLIDDAFAEYTHRFIDGPQKIW